MSEFTINKVHRKTLNQIVYESIRNSIMSGEIKPGTKLAEVIIARQMSVSPTPVREAFRMLATEGLVRIEPWKGAIVQSMTPAGELEAAQCRCALELLALELWFPRKTPGEIGLLEQLLLSCAQFDSDEDFVRASIRMHNVWVEGSGNKKLGVLLDQMKDPMIHSRYQLLPTHQNKLRVFEEHAAIIAFIKEENLDGAAGSLREHILQGCYTEQSLLSHSG